MELLCEFSANSGLSWGGKGDCSKGFFKPVVSNLSDLKDHWLATGWVDVNGCCLNRKWLLTFLTVSWSSLLEIFLYLSCSCEGTPAELEHLGWQSLLFLVTSFNDCNRSVLYVYIYLLFFMVQSLSKCDIRRQYFSDK